MLIELDGAKIEKKSEERENHREDDEEDNRPTERWCERLVATLLLLDSILPRQASPPAIISIV